MRFNVTAIFDNEKPPILMFRRVLIYFSELGSGPHAIPLRLHQQVKSEFEEENLNKGTITLYPAKGGLIFSGKLRWTRH